MHSTAYLDLLGALLQVGLSVDEDIVVEEGDVTGRGRLGGDEVFVVGAGLLDNVRPLQQDDTSLARLQHDTSM